MLTYNVKFGFHPPSKGYIANPYWPVLAKVIDIQKNSGMNRAKSTANRRKALEEYLKGVGMSLTDYEKMQAAAAEPFYRDDKTREIVIPENHLLSFLVATCDEARAAARPCDPTQVRSRFVVTPFTTGRTEHDGIWERFALVSAGTGQKLSNQRGLRVDKFVKDFDAEGTLTFDPSFVDPKTLKQALSWGGQMVGIGSARKMGWGRFTLEGFDKV